MDKQQSALRRRGVGLALLLGVGGTLLVGCNRGGDQTASNPPAPTTPPAKTSDSGSTVAGAPPVGGPLTGPGLKAKGFRGQQAAGGPGAKADPFAAPGAAGGAGAKGTQIASAPKNPSYDPFKVTWTKAPPPPDPLAIGDVQPIRVASAGYVPPPEQEVTVREVPDRRVSGIMSGDGVFAIIEQNGDSEVVKPGGTTKDGYRVVSINEDSVKLQKKVGNLIYTQTVQLSDIQTGGPMQSFGRPGGVGQAGFGFPGGQQGFGQPGYGRPGGGRPGLGGGGKSD